MQEQLLRVWPNRTYIVVWSGPVWFELFIDPWRVLEIWTLEISIGNWLCSPFSHITVERIERRRKISLETVFIPFAKKEKRHFHNQKRTNERYQPFTTFEFLASLFHNFSLKCMTLRYRTSALTIMNFIAVQWDVPVKIYCSYFQFFNDASNS